MVGTCVMEIFDHCRHVGRGCHLPLNKAPVPVLRELYFILVAYPVRSSALVLAKFGLSPVRSTNCCPLFGVILSNCNKETVSYNVLHSQADHSSQCSFVTHHGIAPHWFCHKTVQQSTLLVVKEMTNLVSPGYTS